MFRCYFANLWTRDAVLIVIELLPRIACWDDCLIFTVPRLYPGIPSWSWFIAITFLFCSTALNSGFILLKSVDNINGDAIIDHTAIWALLWSNVIPALPITNYIGVWLVFLLWTKWYRWRLGLSSWEICSLLHQHHSKPLGAQCQPVLIAVCGTGPWFGEYLTKKVTHLCRIAKYCSTVVMTNNLPLNWKSSA